MPGEDEPLHAYITAPIRECVNKAIKRINEIIKEGVEIPENENDLRKSQMKELALLNGTFREVDGISKLKAIAEAQTIVTNTIICSICGGAGHIPSDCIVDKRAIKLSLPSDNSAKEKAKMDSEYSALMEELGVDRRTGGAKLPWEPEANGVGGPLRSDGGQAHLPTVAGPYGHQTYLRYHPSLAGPLDGFTSPQIFPPASLLSNASLANRDIEHRGSSSF